MQTKIRAIVTYWCLTNLKQLLGSAVVFHNRNVIRELIKLLSYRLSTPALEGPALYTFWVRSKELTSTTLKRKVSSLKNSSHAMLQDGQFLKCDYFRPKW